MKRLAIILGILAFLLFMSRNSICTAVQLLDTTTYVENIMAGKIDTGKMVLNEMYQKALHNPSNAVCASDINLINNSFTDASQYAEYLSNERNLKQPTSDTLFIKIRTCYAVADALTLSDTLKVAIRESGQKISGSKMEEGFLNLKESGGAKIILFSMQIRVLEDGARCLREYAGRR